MPADPEAEELKAVATVVVSVAESVVEVETVEELGSLAIRDNSQNYCT